MVRAGEYTNSAAEKYLGDVLIKRRDKIKSAYLTAVNPIVTPRLASNQLTFENAAIAAGVAKGPVTYRASWLQFDNATGETRPMSETQSETTTLDAPRGLPAGSNSYVAVDISADSAAHPTWKKPVRAYFRGGGGSWTLVGFDRIPETGSSAQAAQKPPQKPGR
jgi:hypothetical protein